MAMETMRAIVVPALGAKLEVRDVPVPEPGPGQVLIRMEASGLCHTDIHAANGDWPVKPTAPFTPGHEGVGVVAATGPGARLHAVGDRVAIAWLGSACGHCSYCISGWETLCESQQNSGYSVDGAWAEYAVADDQYVIAVPSALTSLDAAPLTCAGVTTFKAVKVSRIQPGETAVVFGIGGLGHLALQYARLSGARVIAVDVVEDKLDLARELGADYVINAAETDPVAAIRDLGGADVGVCLATSTRAFRSAAVMARAFSSHFRRRIPVIMPGTPSSSMPRASLASRSDSETTPISWDDSSSTGGLR